MTSNDISRWPIQNNSVVIYLSRRRQNQHSNQHRATATRAPCRRPSPPLQTGHKISNPSTMNNLVAAAAAAMENDSQFDGGFQSEAENVALGVALGTIPQADSAGAAAPLKQTKRRKTTDGKDISAAKARRLEQNRRAASESRRRKKVMVSFFVSAIVSISFII